MIPESLLYLATLPLTSKANRGFIRSSVSLWSRARRCSQQWAEHERNSKDAIVEAMAGLRQKRTAVVLGSGLLRDVPIEALARDFDTVVLVDLVHLASVRLWLRAKGFRNVRLIERDLSGFDEFMSGGSAEPLGFLRQVPYLDFVVSANLLSQIGRGIKRRIEAEPRPGLPEDAGARLITAHIEGLAGLPCKTCLVTDTAYSVIDRTGRLHEEEDLLFDVVPPTARHQWTWTVAPLGEESADYQIIHRVIAA